MENPLIEQIISLSDDALKPYLTLRREEGHKREGIVVAEGGRVVERLLASRLRIRSLLLTEEWYQRVIPLLRARGGPPYRVFRGEIGLLREIVGFRLHQGIMAVAECPPEPSLEELPTPHLLVALDGLMQSENVGVIVRSCAALGASGIICGETSSSPWLRRAVRNSMGAVFFLPVFHTSDLAATCGLLRERFGTAIIGADVNGERELREANFDGNVCCVAGNEESGLSDRVAAICSCRVRIPMYAGVDSLNVAGAVTVFLYEAGNRRRGITGASPGIPGRGSSPPLPDQRE